MDPSNLHHPRDWRLSAARVAHWEEGHQCYGWGYSTPSQTICLMILEESLVSGSDPQKRPESKYRRSSAPPGPVEWSRHQGIVMMMSKLKLGKKEKYVRAGLGMYLTGSC